MKVLIFISESVDNNLHTTTKTKYVLSRLAVKATTCKARVKDVTFKTKMKEYIPAAKVG